MNRKTATGIIALFCAAVALAAGIAGRTLWIKRKEKSA